MSQPQGNSETGMIISIKNSNDTIGNRTRDLPVCSTVAGPVIKQKSISNVQTEHIKENYNKNE
jgi:hypothetical protein